MSQKIEKMKSREVMFEKSPCSKNEFLQLRTLVILRNLDAIKSALKHVTSMDFISPIFDSF